MLICLHFVTACGGEASITSPASEFLWATRAVDAWVSAHPDEWIVHINGSNSLVRPEWSAPCSQNPPSGQVTLRYSAPGTEIDLHFDCPLTAAASAADLAAAFSIAVLLPPHGIESPGWSFRVVTPSSAVRTGVTFAPPAAGRLLVTIDTPLYAVYGNSTRPACEPIPDGAYAEGCSLRREHPIPLRLTLLVPFDVSALN